jgi:hypothetical protein
LIISSDLPNSVNLPKSSRGGVTTSASPISPILTGNCRHGGRSSKGISNIRELCFSGVCAKAKEDKNKKIKVTRKVFFIEYKKRWENLINKQKSMISKKLKTIF